MVGKRQLNCHLKMHAVKPCHPTLLADKHISSFRHDRWVKSGEFSQEFSQSFQTTQQEVFCTDAFTTATQGVEQPGAAGRGRKWCIKEITWSCFQHPNTIVSSYHRKLSWHLCQCLLCVWHRFSTRRYLFSFSCLNFCVCRVLEASSSQIGFSWLSMNLKPGGQVCRNRSSHLDICVHTCSPRESTTCLKAAETCNIDCEGRMELIMCTLPPRTVCAQMNIEHIFKLQEKQKPVT